MAAFTSEPPEFDLHQSLRRLSGLPGWLNNALDVGLFCSPIKDTGLNALEASTAFDARPDRYAQLERLGEIFLSHYQSAAPVSRHRAALWQAFDFLRNSLHYWIKAKPAEPDNALFMLERQLEVMGIS